MPFYRKKPVVIEARRVTRANAVELADWCGGTPSSFGLATVINAVDIPTLEGTMRANHGDYIIKGVRGEFYPCKADIFEETYELVDMVTWNN